MIESVAEMRLRKYAAAQRRMGDMEKAKDRSSGRNGKKRNRECKASCQKRL